MTTVEVLLLAVFATLLLTIFAGIGAFVYYVRAQTKARLQREYDEASRAADEYLKARRTGPKLVPTHLGKFEAEFPAHGSLLTDAERAEQGLK